MSTVRTATYDLLRDLGLTTMFGNPGSTEEPFLTGFPEDFRYILGLHEAAVVSMADGYAQASGRAAFINLHTAPGVGNAMGSVVTAWYNRAPLVISAGQQTRQMLALEPWLVSLDATELPKPYVKWSDEPVRPEDVPGAIERAYHIAMAPPRGPVFVSIPMDDWAAPAAPRAPRRVESQSCVRDQDLEELAADLNAARNPALVVGGGVDRSGGWEAALSLAERLQAPVWEAPAPERASFPQNHPLFQGALPLAIAPLAKALAEHDLVLVAGASIFRYYPYIPGEHLAEGTRLVQITDDPDEATRAPVGTSLVGDVGDALHRLAPRVNQATRKPPSPRAAPRQPEPVNPISVDYAMQAVSAATPDDVLITEESASMRAPFYDQFRIARPASYFATASGGLGFAMPAAVGVSLAQPDRPVLSIVGDGSAMFGIHALWTAAQHRCPIVYVVMNNGGYSILKAFADFQRTPGVPGLDLPGLDITSIAAGLGVRSQRVTNAADLPDACRAAFTDAISQRRPILLDVVVDSTVPKVFG
jgi:benzoylformate decarboxylase